MSGQFTKEEIESLIPSDSEYFQYNTEDLLAIKKLDPSKANEIEIVRQKQYKEAEILASSINKISSKKDLPNHTIINATAKSISNEVSFDSKKSEIHIHAYIVPVSTKAPAYQFKLCEHIFSLDLHTKHDTEDLSELLGFHENEFDKGWHAVYNTLNDLNHKILDVSEANIKRIFIAKKYKCYVDPSLVR